MSATREVSEEGLLRDLTLRYLVMTTEGCIRDAFVHLSNQVLCANPREDFFVYVSKPFGSVVTWKIVIDD